LAIPGLQAFQAVWYVSDGIGYLSCVPMHVLLWILFNFFMARSRSLLPLLVPHTFFLFSQAYQWSRPIPTSLKVIHSRVYAQAITLGALGAVAAIEIYAQNKGLDTKQEEK
jgi:hypothetical protein